MKTNMKIIQTPKAPSAIGPYSQAIIANGFLYTSGVLAINPINGLIDEETIEGQTNLVLTHIQSILEEAGSSFNQVVKTTIYLKNMNDFPTVNQIYKNYFKDHKPARSTIEVARLPKDAKIEIELIALI